MQTVSLAEFLTRPGGERLHIDRAALRGRGSRDAVPLRRDGRPSQTLRGVAGSGYAPVFWVGRRFSGSRHSYNVGPTDDASGDDARILELFAERQPFYDFATVRRLTGATAERMERALTDGHVEP